MLQRVSDLVNVWRAEYAPSEDFKVLHIFHQFRKLSQKCFGVAQPSNFPLNSRAMGSRV